MCFLIKKKKRVKSLYQYCSFLTLKILCDDVFPRGHKRAVFFHFVRNDDLINIRVPLSTVNIHE